MSGMDGIEVMKDKGDIFDARKNPAIRQIAGTYKGDGLLGL